ncbi:MAG: DinB family protein, partial [Terriglobales bacterium]
MRYDFLVETYATERIKVISVWTEFRDEDLPARPRPDDPRGRSVHEQMVHQCVSEDLWFRTMLGIDVEAPPLPKQEARLQFMKQYAQDSGKRLAQLEAKQEDWWEGLTNFFSVRRSRAWVMTRRIAHTSHHRGQLM